MKRRQQFFIPSLLTIGLASASGAVLAQQDHDDHDQGMAAF